MNFPDYMILASAVLNLVLILLYVKIRVKLWDITDELERARFVIDTFLEKEKG